MTYNYRTQENAFLLDFFLGDELQNSIFVSHDVFYGLLRLFYQLQNATQLLTESFVLTPEESININRDLPNWDYIRHPLRSNYPDD